MKALLFALLALTNEPPSNACQFDSAGFCTDQVVRWSLSNDYPDPIVRINVALGTAVSVEFPPHVGTRGNPSVGNKNILEHKVDSDGKSPSDPLRLTLWPKMPPGIGQVEQTALYGHKTNVNIALDSGLTIILEVKLSPPNASTQRLLFDFPDRKKESLYVQEKLAEERQKILSELAKERDSLAAEIKKGVKESLGRGMLTYEHCKDLRERAMRDLLIVRATKICRIGDLITLKFVIQNRARDLFSLDKIEIMPDGKDSAVDAMLTFDSPGDPMLGFDTEVRGIAVFDVPKESNAARYSFKVVESSGKQRSVTVQAGL